MEVLNPGVAGKRLAIVLVGLLSVIFMTGSGRSRVLLADKKAEFNVSQVEAVFIYNLLHFVEWPAEKENGDITITIFGDRQVAENLKLLVGDERSRNRRVKVVQCRRVADIGDCHILFVGAGKLREMPAVRRQVAGKPILLVGDRDGFLAAGGMVKLARLGNRITLAVNPSAARKVGLSFNSRLLRLARIVSISH